jgi:hypothetical protein
MLVEVLLGMVESRRRQEDVPPESMDERAAAEVADGESDVVADDRADHRHQDHQRDVHVARAREDRRGDQYGFAGYRHAEILEEHEAADGQIAVVFEQRLQVPEHTG